MTSFNQREMVDEAVAIDVDFELFVSLLISSKTEWSNKFYIGT